MSTDNCGHRDWRILEDGSFECRECGWIEDDDDDS